MFRFIQPVHVHLKTDKVDLKKSHSEKKFFCIFFQSSLGMKNIVRCYKDFFGYFKALKTHGEMLGKRCNVL